MEKLLDEMIVKPLFTLLFAIEIALARQISIED